MQIKIKFTNHSYIFADHSKDLEEFLRSIKPQTADYADIRILSTYFQYQWPHQQLFLDYEILGDNNGKEEKQGYQN